MPDTNTPETTTEFTPGETVKVVNVGDTPQNIGWNGTSYKLNPGRDEFVPVEAVIAFFGHPESTVPGKVGPGSASAELSRISALYGGHMNFQPEFPQVEVYKLDGTRLAVPTDKSAADTASTATFAPTDSSVLEARIAQLEQEKEVLTQQVQTANEANAAAEESNASDDEDVEVEDTPVPEDGANSGGSF